MALLTLLVSSNSEAGTNWTGRLNMLKSNILGVSTTRDSAASRLPTHAHLRSSLRIMLVTGTSRLPMHLRSSLRIMLVTGTTQGSQTRRRVEIQGPKARNFGNCGRVFDQLIEILARNGGCFVDVSTISPAKSTWPPSETPWWAAGLNCLRPFHQLVEISKKSLRALVRLSHHTSAIAAMLATGHCSIQVPLHSYRTLQCCRYSTIAFGTCQVCVTHKVTVQPAVVP
jgi:hypothetical protein